MAKGLDGDQWTLGSSKVVSMEQFWIWSNVGAIDRLGDLVTGPECGAYFEKYLWFELVKSICRKHRSTFQDHIKYIHNNIVNPFRVGILQYSELIREMQDLFKYLPPP